MSVRLGYPDDKTGLAGLATQRKSAAQPGNAKIRQTYERAFEARC